MGYAALCSLELRTWDIRRRACALSTIDNDPVGRQKLMARFPLARFVARKWVEL